MMTSEQSRLLHKLQLMRHPAFMQINPVVVGEEEAAELFKQNLPVLEYQTAVAVKPDRQFEEKTFWGVNEYDCKKQIDRWIDENNFELFQRPNPYFGLGEEWLKYFAQPIRQVNLASMEKHFAEWEIKIPKETREITETDKDGKEHIRKQTFSRLELAFDDADPGKLEFVVEKQKARDFADLHKITPGQRVEIKALQAAGKAPVISRDEYLKMDRNAAEEYLKRNRNNPEHSFDPVSYEKKVPEKKPEAFPEFRPANLLGKYPADYLQKSILRDLVAEGHIATPATRQEFLDKMQFITKEQAAELIAPRADLPAGAGLIEQCRAYCEFGEIHDSPAIKTIADVRNLYQVHRSFDFDAKAALRDLVDDGHITSPDAQAKIEYLSPVMDEKLLDKFGDAPMGSRVRARLLDLMADGAIGGMEEEHFRNLTVKDAMYIISMNSEIAKTYIPHPASARQKELLHTMEHRGQIDLSKVDMENLTAREAHNLIDVNIRNQSQNLAGPATDRQKNLLKTLIGAGAIPSVPYAEWKNLSKQEASQLIDSVPEEKRSEILSAQRRTNAPEIPDNAPKGRGIE